MLALAYHDIDYCDDVGAGHLCNLGGCIGLAVTITE
jgi:hypothetical protein